MFSNQYLSEKPPIIVSPLPVQMNEFSPNTNDRFLIHLILINDFPLFGHFLLSLWTPLGQSSWTKVLGPKHNTSTHHLTNNHCQ